MPFGMGQGPRLNVFGPGSERSIQSNFERLSSGKRINRAADDASGLAISESLQALSRSLAAADQNTARARAVTAVKEGGLSQIGDITTRMRELAVQAADGSLSENDRKFIDEEFQALKSELGRVSETTEFNDHELLAGSEQQLGVQVGAGTSASDQLNVAVGGVTTGTLGVDGLSVSGTDGSAAVAAIDSIDAALEKVNSARAENGASYNRLEMARESASERRVGLLEAESRIRDADYAEETSNLARNKILQRARVAVSAQANQAASLTLNLLR